MLRAPRAWFPILFVVLGCTSPAQQHAGSQAQALQTLPAPSSGNPDRAIANDRAFRGWLAKTDRTTAEGESLAAARAPTMRALLLSDPRTAISYALSPVERAQLPVEIARHIEQWRDGRGMLHVIGSTDGPLERFVSFEGDPRFLRAAVYGRREGQATRENLRLHGVALDGVIALTDSPLRRLFPGEVVASLPIENGKCPVSKKNAEEGLGYHGADALYGFCVPGHADMTEQTLADAEDALGNGSSLAPASVWTEGPKTVLFIRVDFSDKPGDPVGQTAAETLINNTCNAFYVANSFNKTTMTTVVTPTLRMTKTAADYIATDNYLSLMADARAAAKAAGFDTAGYNLDIVGFPAMFGGWAGRGYVGSKGTWLNGNFSLRVTAHELGHNYGVYHANFWNAGTSIIGAGTNVEYGNPFDVMGNGGGAANHFNAWFKRTFEWVLPAEVQTVTASGTYRIQAIEQAVTSGLHALKVPRGGGRDYWLEYRPAIGNAELQNGASINFGYAYTTGSHLLDMTPDGNTSNSALVIGRTFSDPLAGIHFTPIAKLASTPPAIDLVVNLGTFPGNNAPVLTLAASQTAVAANATVTFTATASDPDGDALAYAWDFDDGSFGTNTASVMKTLPTARVYNVQCTVSDMKGKKATASIAVTVGTPTTFTLAGIIKDGSVPLEGVRVTDGTRDTFTGTDGKYVLTNVPAGDFTVTATKFDYAFVRGFAAPLTVAASATGLDFTGTPKAGYNVVGKVMAGSAGVAGVVITDGSRTATTNASGDYTLTTVPNGRYTLTATLPGWQLVPNGFTNPVEVYGGNVTANFYATGQFLSGTLPGSITATPVVTDGLRTATVNKAGANWNWSMNAVPNGQWNLVATAPGVTLVPSTFTNPVTIAGMSKNNLNFQIAATSGFQVSGTVKTGGTPLPGVTISDGTRTAVTDSVGKYTLVGVPAGAFTLTPTAGGYSFVPATLSITVTNANLTGRDFVTTVVNLPPTVATAASASPNPVVTGSMTALSVLGADDAGEAALNYTWAVNGFGYPVVFSANGTNGAKNTGVTFSGAGTYTIEVTITDAGGLLVRSSVVVTVQQVATAMEVTPPTANVLTGANQIFTGNLKDQFAKYMFAGSVAWTLSGGGTYVPQGSVQAVFTAGATAGGPFTLTGTASGKSASAVINVVAAGSPTLVSGAKANPNPVNGKTTQLEVRANDDAGEAGLVYRWTAPLAPAPVVFSVNDNNAAKDAVATFSKAGDYDLLVTIVDGVGNQISSLVKVTVNATPTAVAVQPAVATLQPGQTQNFSATVEDQFGDSLAVQPVLTWTIPAAAGTVDSAGVVMAATAAGGPFMLTATAGTVSGTSQVTIAAGPDTVAPMVVLSAPLASARLIGPSMVAAMASDDVAVAKVQFFSDAVLLGESLAAPYTLTFDASTQPNGAHLLTAKAVDASGNSATSDAVPVVFGPEGMADTTPPVVTIIKPAMSAVTGLEADIEVRATDDVGVTKLELELDGKVTANVPRLTVKVGPHTLVAIASDAAGHVARSAPVSFTAQTVAPPPDVRRNLTGGCGCGTTEGTPFALGLILLGLASVARRRRAR